MSTKSAHLLLNPLLRQARFVKRLPRRYIGALLIVALLASLGQILIQTLLSQQADSGHVISLAANQEILSQRVSKDALALVVFTDAKDRAFYFQEFTAVGASWNRVHLGLQHGDMGLRLPANHDAIIAQDFQALQPQYNAILNAYSDVEQFVQAYGKDHPDAPYGFDATPLVPDVQAVMTAEEPFARGMEGIVNRFEQLASNQVQTVRMAEIGLFAALLMVLLLEGLFIFAPALRTLKDDVHSLENSENRLREAANTLTQRNKQLEDAFQEAWQARSKTLLPVRKVSGGYIVATTARDRVVHVTRDTAGALVCECSANELGYVCTHILSVSHFQLVAQRAQQQREQTGSGPQAWGRSQPSQPMQTRSQPWSRSQPSQPSQPIQTGSQPWGRSQPRQGMETGSKPSWMLNEPEPPWEPSQSAARSIRQRAQSRGWPGTSK
ncbi:MAG TPA: hypothetical protein VFU32_06130 [Ktedonobacterales bacterium]|nr:hypothetical protein [Ktedonobacterales bacterium]